MGVKKVSGKDKQDFRAINEVFGSLDADTQIFLMGYAKGLREKNQIKALVAKEQLGEKRRA